ncbi:hypothetical protein, partial [Xylanibacter rodentium]|uniref:hypothetical protein n=1 Tax=Xylanibacter rodentium TaxID=2736289 RepID=UPI001C12D860
NIKSQLFKYHTVIAKFNAILILKMNHKLWPPYPAGRVLPERVHSLYCKNPYSDFKATDM